MTDDKVMKIFEEAGVTFDGEYADMVRLKTWKSSLQSETETLISQSGVHLELQQLMADAGKAGDAEKVKLWQTRIDGLLKDMDTTGGAIRTLRAFIKASEAKTESTIAAHQQS